MKPAPSQLAAAPASESGSAPVLCGELDIRIARDGTWYYHGSPIGRKELVCLFASVLHREEDGSYWMITPAEMGRIEVEDVPFVAVELFTCQSGREQAVSVRTNVDEMVTLCGDHPLRLVADEKTGQSIPYVEVRPGLDARLSRSVYYELVELGIEERLDGESQYGIWSMGSFFPLGALEE
ncbi:DUF1285 domain-containing protein [Magnetospira sp. QH-2]|uniref:DUF1285 domain-containing protein n=1 Tax=Magnetospira sp. (strain QH-2) TaxID=1288970 RepID=UPI0003E81B2D|nr:DUF1285 domain-containing protein [Magnetospira sp. QH-2]CCQ72730.1 conserved protein of unknown function [Magnetospira sp. QH-2]